MKFQLSFLSLTGITLLICANPIAWIFGGGIPLIIVIAFFLFLFSERGIQLGHLFFFIIIAFIVIFYNNVYPNTSKFKDEYILNFFYIGIISFLYGLKLNSPEKLLRILFPIAILYYPFLITIDMGNPEVSIEWGKWMGISYGVLRFWNIIIISLIITKSRKTKVISFIGLLAYCVYYALFGSRGAILGAGLCLFLTYIIKKDLNISRVLYFTIKCLILLLIPFIILVVYSNEIIQMLEKNDIHILFFEKIIELSSKGDLSNGRDGLINLAWEGISEAPLFGHGIGSFELLPKANGLYVHNLLFQLWYECGIIPLLMMISLIIYSLIYTINNKNEVYSRIMVVFLLCSGVCELFFSSVFWKSQLFWIYVGFSLQLLNKDLNIMKSQNIKLLSN